MAFRLPLALCCAVPRMQDAGTKEMREIKGMWPVLAESPAAEALELFSKPSEPSEATPVRFQGQGMLPNLERGFRGKGYGNVQRTGSSVLLDVVLAVNFDCWEVRVVWKTKGCKSKELKL